MKIDVMSIRKGTVKWLIAAALPLLVVGGYGVYWHRNADLNALRNVGTTIPPNIPSSAVVKQDHGRRVLRDSDLAIPGHYTIVEYRQKNCPSCAQLDTELERFLMLRKDVAVRKVDLPDQWSDKTTLRDYGRTVWYTPFIVIYGVDGKQIRADQGGNRAAANLLRDWLKSEFTRAQIKSD